MVSKAREALEKVTSSSNGESHICSSGIKITVMPLPPYLLRRLEAKNRKDHPEPIPPKKTIQVLDGTEEVDDLNNPEYVAAKQAFNSKLIELEAEAIVDFCVDIEGGIEAYANLIARIERRIGEKYPDDPDEKRYQFLSEYVIRSTSDWGFVFASAIEQAQATDPEVSARMDSFRGNVAQTETNGSTPSGISEVERVGVQPTV